MHISIFKQKTRLPMSAHSLYLMDGPQNDLGLKANAKSLLRDLTPLRIFCKSCHGHGLRRQFQRRVPKTGLENFDLELPVPSLHGLEEKGAGEVFECCLGSPNC